MPTENELKFVLDLRFSQDLQDGEIRSTEVERFMADPDPIKQAYLYGDVGLSVRIRGVYRTIPHFMLTVKQKLNDRTVEVEALISERDFDDLWITSTEHLIKDRYILLAIRNGVDYMWEIDLFLDADGRCYFVQAEHEMPEGQAEPNFIPDLVQQYLLYAVPRKDTGDFSSRKLSDIGYAEHMYQRVKK